MEIWLDAIPRSVPFDYAIAIKAFASTSPPRPNQNVVRVSHLLAYSHLERVTAVHDPFCP